MADRTAVASVMGSRVAAKSLQARSWSQRSSMGDGLLGRPDTIERLEIGGEIVGGDGAVGGDEMGEEGQSGDIGEAEVFVAQLLDVG
jgi:hypothetical protein